MPRSPFYSALLAIFLPWSLGQAHPIPDIPVRGYFSEGGSGKVVVEVNPRCFDADPTKAPSMLKPDFEKLTADQKEALKIQAAE